MTRSSRRRWIVARLWVVVALGSVFLIAAAFGLALAIVGSGDRWIMLVAAAGCVGLVGLMWARGTVSISEVGIRSGFPWRRRMPWGQLSKLEYKPGSSELVAVRYDGTCRVLALVPGFFWDTHARSDLADQRFLSRTTAAAQEFGWKPPTQESTSSSK